MTVLKLNGLTGNRPEDYQINPQYSILVLNIMPNKIETEQQISRLFAELQTPVALTFLYPRTHQWKHGNQSELAYHYATFDAIREQYFDGLIVTGAPLEKLPFTDVDYWNEFNDIRNWSKTHTFSQLFTCWSAQAALYSDYQVPKVNLKKKIFGVFENQIHTNLPRNFLMPQSRFSKVERQIIEQIPQLEVLADNIQTGPFVLQAREHHSIYVLGHPEYSEDTLVNEYYRDLKKNKPIQKPINISLENPLTSYLRFHNSSLNLYQNWLDQIQKEKDNNDSKQLQI